MSTRTDTLFPSTTLFRSWGKGLKRPECILAERDGSLWVADARGGVTWIKPDGSQALVTQTADKRFDLVGNAKESLLVGTLPNGLAFAENGDILIANFGTDRLEVRSEEHTSELQSLMRISYAVFC